MIPQTHQATRRWLVLAAVVTGQLMVGVDATILALALPQLTDELRLAASAAAWAMAGYVLAAGSLMIPGGRVAQAVGLVRTMTLGLVVFAVASVLGGAAATGEQLIAARVVQGVGAALLTPAAMARLSAAFTGESRARAYGMFGAVMGSATAIGLLLGGLLADLFGWRACMFINVVFVGVVLVVSGLARDRPARSPGHLRGTWRGVLLAAGTGLLLFALTTVEMPLLAAIAASTGVAAIAAFVAAEVSSRDPLIPVVLFTDRERRDAYLALFLWGVATIATFVGASRALQQTLSPLVTGLVFLVYPAAIQLGLLAARRAGGRPAARLIGIGLLVIAAGQTMLALAPPALGWVLLALAVMGLGTSLVMPNANSAMNANAGAHAGVAGGVGITLQQLGASLGLALPVALSATAPQHAPQLAAGLTAIALVAGALRIFADRTGAEGEQQP